MNTRSGFVVIFGKPNAGKSTLLNSLLNYNLSIVNRKVQTTRDRIMGILTEDNYQIIFIDTPGILEPKYELQNYMVSEIRTSLVEADLVIHIVDAAKVNFEDIKKVNEDYKELLSDKKKIIVLNKIDLMKKDNLLPVIQKLINEFNYNEIIPVSALKKENTDELKKVILSYIPEGHFFYDSETLTDKPEKFFVNEIIREKILDMYHEEIPYSVMVDVTEFKERSNDLTYIGAEITVERETQKIIIIGNKGANLRKLGERSRNEIEKFLNKKVYLELFVKVRKDWRNNKKFIKDKMISNNPS
ncbi:MAG: GTPase Era [Ignavibacteriae bacterium]|nr:GTPase Era [Ignavibacteriota bacterium]